MKKGNVQETLSLLINPTKIYKMELKLTKVLYYNEPKNSDKKCLLFS